MPSRSEQESLALLSTFNGFQGCFTYETVQIRSFLDSLVGKTSTFLYKPTGRENLGGSVTSLIPILFYNIFFQKSDKLLCKLCALQAAVKHAKKHGRFFFWVALLPVSSVFPKVKFRKHPLKVVQKHKSFFIFSLFFEKSKLF